MTSHLIALVGSPNCGKTALFNILTGSKQKVANYPGVTVERKEGVLTTAENRLIRVLDLPGTYSLRARSPDEKVTRDVILGQQKEEARPDVFVCVANATNLHLGLRLVLEMKKTGRPLILVLNMMDQAKKRGYDVDIALLSSQLQIPVVPTVATQKKGIAQLLTVIEEQLEDLPVMTTSDAPVLWTEPNAHDIRFYHKEVERILCQSRRQQGIGSVWTQRLDHLFLHPVFGLLILFFILFFVFQAVFSWAKIPQEAIQDGFNALQGFLNQSMSKGPLQSLLTDGILAGVGSVVVFLPQIITLFFFILLLEDSGYMARAAFLMDKLMGRVGLHGRAFIPLLSSFACAIPGIMSTRTIENKQDRLITILIAPLMTCSARIPVYTLIISAFVPNRQVAHFFNLQGLVFFSLYALGIVTGLIVAFVLKTFFFKKETSPLLIELPTYKLPSPRNIVLGLLERAKLFIRKAGTIILAMMVVIWFVCSYPLPPTDATDLAINHSFAGQFGRFVQPLFAPIGFSWQMVVALIPGMAAREVAVAALGTIYSVGGTDEALKEGLIPILAQSWTLPSALSLLVWYAFAQQCASTLAVTKRETNSWIWPTVMFVYMTALAYGGAFAVYHLAKAYV